uniref:Solute carrier family 40 member n=1 Tax=Petromyzon marinus TaxID=7757 RepID=S4RH88_PETMA
MGKPLRTLRYGWVAYYRQSAFLPGLGLAFLYMTVLGFDGITTGYAYAQGVSTSVLSIMVGLSATLGLVGTVLYLRARRRCGLVRTGALFSLAQVCCLLLCVMSVFAPGSPLDLTAPLHKPRLVRLVRPPPPPPSLLVAEPTVAYEANGTWFQNVTTNGTATVQPQILDYTSISLFFAGAILSRVGLWGFDLSVTQIFQETVAESERGVV